MSKKHSNFDVSAMDQKDILAEINGLLDNPESAKLTIESHEDGDEEEIPISKIVTFEEGTIDILKASTGKWSKCVFPYEKNGKPLELSDFAKHKEAYEYLEKHKEYLIKDIY